MCLFQFHSFGHWIHQIFLLNWVICDCLDSICALAFNSFQIWIYLWKIIAYFGLTCKGTCMLCCSACASDICCLLLKLPSCTLVCGIVWTLARNGKGYALVARYVGSRYVGYALVARYVGMCLEPAMLCRPPMTSLRRGWMELPDVGDLCLLVIQKWMDHIMLWSHFTFYVFDMISKALAMFLCMLWIRMKWMHRYVTFELLFMFCSLIYFRNVIRLCYTLKATICHRMLLMPMICSNYLSSIV